MLIKQTEILNWKNIATEMPGFTARQCRERWTHHLSPDIVKTQFTEEEAALLIEKVEQFGRKWKVLQSFFIGRTGNQLKNLYNQCVRKGKSQPHRSVQDSTSIWHSAPQSCNKSDSDISFEEPVHSIDDEDFFNDLEMYRLR
jgi:hypothetical protein